MDTLNILLITYNRPQALENTIQSLLLCNRQLGDVYLQLNIMVSSDGPKDKEDEINVNNSREVIKKYKLPYLFCHTSNIGLKNNILTSVSQALKQYKHIVVIEDDLILSKNFLEYMQRGLMKYETDNLVESISAYSPIESKFPFLSYRFQSWGWATWKHKWERFNKHKEITDQDIKLLSFISDDLPRIATHHKQNKPESFAILYQIHHLKYHRYTLSPNVTKVNSSMKGGSNYKTINKNHIQDIDKDTYFKLNLPFHVDQQQINKLFIFYKYTIYKRLKLFILDTINYFK